MFVVIHTDDQSVSQAHDTIGHSGNRCVMCDDHSRSA